MVYKIFSSILSQNIYSIYICKICGYNAQLDLSSVQM